MFRVKIYIFKVHEIEKSNTYVYVMLAQWAERGDLRGDR